MLSVDAITQTSTLWVHTGPGTRTHVPPSRRPSLTCVHTWTPALGPLPPSFLALTWSGPHGWPWCAGHRLHQGYGLSGDLSLPQRQRSGGSSKATAYRGQLVSEAPPEAPLCPLFHLGPARPCPSPECQVLPLHGSSAPSGSSGPPRGGPAASRTPSRRPSWWVGH